MERTLKLIDECVYKYLLIRFDEDKNGNLQVPSSGRQFESHGPSLPCTEYVESSFSKVVPDDKSIQSAIPLPSRAPPPSPCATSPARSNSVPMCSHNEDFEPHRWIFRPLEHYLLNCFSGIDCLNASFLTSRPSTMIRAASDSAAIDRVAEVKNETLVNPSSPWPELDAKTLLLGDVAENGMWWTGKGTVGPQQRQHNGFRLTEDERNDRVTSKSPCVNWQELNDWYFVLFSVGVSWRDRLRKMEKANPNISAHISPDICRQVEEELTEARGHVQQTVFKASELLLRRPGRLLRKPEDCRFLLILLRNPLLHSQEINRPLQTTNNTVKVHTIVDQSSSLRYTRSSSRPPSFGGRSPSKGGANGRHSGIIKRILGLFSTLPIDCHQYLISWFSRFDEPHFRQNVELICGFVSYRLSRQHGRNCSHAQDPSGFMIPNVSGLGAGTSAQLHAALGTTTTKSSEKSSGTVDYTSDWQIKAAARTMSLLFSANNNDPPAKPDGLQTSSSTDAFRNRVGSAARKRSHRGGQLLPTNAFYVTMLDYANLVADFEIWESRKPGKFAFCQYPMFLSIWAKIQIMEYDARRQMETMARDAFFNSIMSRKVVNQYLVLKVRRECLVEDSLRSVSEVVGSGEEEIKKGLRIEFIGEEGLDSGGLRKEWFLLLVREIFDPEHGLFVYDDDSKYCYFNPNTFETSDQFFLVGVLLGLAIYNSTILDVALPPFTFRKLLASPRNYTGPNTSSTRPTSAHSLEDLAEFRPTLAHGLRQLLEYEGDVEATFCQDFVTHTERYGQTTLVQLCPNGDKRSVTNANRKEYVDLYIKYLLESSVARQYEPFKRGFFTVCGGNALSLFRPEEVELLVRGSDEPLDVATLRTVAVYENWGKDMDPASEPVVNWFWETFTSASPSDQRKLLSFITGSDRIPAMGATSLVVKIMCLGEHQERYPIARTCFNMIALYRYQSKVGTEEKLWRAVFDSEGFGMK